MEPVQLDFIYGGNAATEGKKIVQTTEQIAAAHVEATKMVARHSATIVELKKDLIALGTAYKKATTPEGKSELLSEIELTKKNILDEKEAVKQLKAELNGLSKTKASAMPDAASIARTAGGYNSLNMSVQQVVRELPAAGMGLNMFFLAISNNLPIMADNIKRARLENEALKASGSSTTPVWKQLLSSLTSWQSALMVGITLLSMYGKEILTWANELITGEKAIKRLTAAQMGLTASNQTMIEALKNGSEFQKAVQSVEQLSTALKNAKGNHELEKKAVDDYNASLGVTFGKVNDVDSALKLINKNKDAYIEAMKAMSFSNAFFAKSAEDAYKAMEVGLKNNSDVLGEKADDLKKKVDEAAERLRSAYAGDGPTELKNEWNSAGQKTIQNVKIPINRLQSELGQAVSAYNNAANEERKRQVEIINKHQDESLRNAKIYYEKYTGIFKENKFVVADEPDGKDGKSGKTSSPASVEADVAKQLMNIRKGINKQLSDQRKQFIADSQKAQKMGGDKELQELQRIQAEAERIILKTGDERTRITNEYEKRISILRKAGKFDEIAAVEAERDEKIAIATKGMVEETDLYQLLSDDKLNIAKATTDALLEELRRRIEAEIAAGNMSVEIGQQMLDKVGRAQSYAQGDKIGNNPFAQLGAAIGNRTAAKKAYNAAKDDPNTTPEDLAKLEDAANKAQASTAAAAGASLDGINQMLGAVVGGLNGLGVLNEQQQKDANNIMGMIGGAATLAKGIATGNPVDMIKGSVDLLVNALDFFDFKTKRLEKAQRKHLQNVKELEASYKKLERAVENALGTDVYSQQRAQIENSKQQIAEYEEWLRLEYQKKKRKRNKDKIAETKERIDELKNSIEDEAKAITESLAQTNAKSLANELADALTTAFADGESAAQAFGNVAEQVMANAVKNALKLQFLEKPMQAAVDQLAKDMESGGALSDAEQKEFRQRIEDAGKIYYEQLAAYSDLFTDNGAGKPQGIKGDVAKMTEETGSALAGQITAMRLNVAALLTNSKSSLDAVGKILLTLEQIKTNTDRLNRIDETLYYLKINGIKAL